MNFLKIAFILTLVWCTIEQVNAQDANVIYQSKDNGMSWTSTSAGLPAGVLINKLLLFQGKVLAATNDHGLFVSNDGSRWEAIGENLPQKIRALASNGENLFAAPWQGGIHVSVDGGNTWQERNLGLFNQEVLAIISHDNLVFVGTGTGIFVSWNNGQTWMKVLSDVQVDDFVVNGSSLYAASPIGVFQSDDHGKNWENILEGIEIRSVLSVKNDLYALTHRKGVLRKSNGGNSWEPYGTGLPEGNSAIYGLSSVGNTLWVGQVGNLYRLVPGEGSWKKLPVPWNKGMPVFQIFPFGKDTILVVLNGFC